MHQRCGSYTKKMIRRLLVILLLTFPISIYGHDCGKLTKDGIYEQADVIFFGRVININDTSFQIKVLENFKGDIKIGDTLTGLIRDYIRPHEKETYWLIYANSSDFKVFLEAMCSGSKSLDIPFGLQDETFPSPPIKEINDNKAFSSIMYEIIKDKSLNEFYFEIGSLRERVKREEIRRITQNLKELTIENQKTQDKLALISWTLFISLGTTLITLTVLLVRQKHIK